jgi:hypothetical protein
MRAEAGLHPFRPLIATFLAPLRWVWRTAALVFGASAPVSGRAYILAGAFFFAGPSRPPTAQ